MGRRDLFQAFTMAFGTPISMGMYFGGMVTGREPSEELVEPLSWTMWNADPGAQRARLPARAHPAQRRVARHHRALGDLRRGAHPRPGRAAGADRRDRRVQRRPAGRLRRYGEFTPYTANFNVTGQPAISLPLFQGDDGLPHGRPARRPPGGRGHAAQPRARSSRRPPVGRPPARARRRLAPARLALELLLVLAARIRAGRGRLRALAVHVLPQDPCRGSAAARGRACRAAGAASSPSSACAFVLRSVRLTFGLIAS